MPRLGEIKIPKDLKVGSVHKSKNYGKFEITLYNNCFNIEFKFIDTGFINRATADTIRSGWVRDKTAPNIYGLGFIGQGEHANLYLGKPVKGYLVWLAMLGRSYSKKNHARFPTYKNCTVAKEWHNYQNFAPWFKENYREGLDLDKDILQEGVANKIYSPDTCKFITPLENLLEAICKEYKLRSPKGELTLVKNMSEFCRNTPKITPSGMSHVVRGRQTHHHGWTLWVDKEVDCEV
jgi:hypothetical protein